MDNSRIELKFAVDDRALGAMESWINCHPAHFKKAHPDRWVNSLYLDNLELESLYDNYSGVSRRVKARVRWYGELEGYNSGNFELKFRKNERGWKEICALKDFTIGHGDNMPRMVRELRQRLTPKIDIWMEQFSWPVTVIRYKRQYFEAATGPYRITVDQKLSNYSQQSGNRINLRRSSPGIEPGLNIVELKFPAPAAREAVQAASQLVKDIPARRSRFSKYAWAASVR